MLYKTKGTCSTMIDIDIDDEGTIRSVKFTGGCNGNLGGISRLVVGRKADEVADLLEGVPCGFKGTSCPDQLSHALRKALEEQQACSGCGGC